MLQNCQCKKQAKVYVKWQLKSNNSSLKIWRLAKEHIKRVVFTVGFTVDFRLRW